MTTTKPTTKPIAPEFNYTETELYVMNLLEMAEKANKEAHDALDMLLEEIDSATKERRRFRKKIEENIEKLKEMNQDFENMYRFVNLLETPNGAK